MSVFIYCVVLILLFFLEIFLYVSTLQIVLNSFSEKKIKYKIFSFIVGNPQNPTPIDLRLAYSPKNTIFEELVHGVAQSLELPGIVGYDTAAELESEMFRSPYLAAIQIDADQVK